MVSVKRLSGIFFLISRHLTPMINIKILANGLHAFPTSGRVFTMNERVNESISRSRSIFNATRTGNGFNKIMSTGNGFNKVIMYILPSRQEREILFEAT